MTTLQPRAEVIAQDEATSRVKSPDGHLHVHLTNISKATVNPYKGSEIPNAEELGLDPGKIYHLLRDPEELAKAAPTFNGKPFLRKHIPSRAKDHSAKVSDNVIGAYGNDTVFEDPYLKNSISIWPQEDIDDIESEMKKEISSGYHYRADMTPGIFRGMPYDGVMRDIVGNHGALVKDGRAGPDVIVGDSMENLMTKPTRLAVLTALLTAQTIAPLLAMDQKLELPNTLFSGITSKNFVDKRVELLASVSKGLTGKLRKGLALDTSMAEVGKVMDAVSGLFGEKEGADAEATAEQTAAMPTAAASSTPAPEFAKDAEPLKAFLKEKGMGDADIMKACDLMPKALAGVDEDPDEKKKREEADAAKKAEDEAKMKDMVTKPAMDAAITAAVQTATKTARETERGIRAAIAEVRPFVGELAATLALDSADDVYRTAAKMLNIEGADTIHASALPTIIKMSRPAGAHPVQTNQTLAMDAATVKSFGDRFPDAARISKA